MRSFDELNDLKDVGCTSVCFGGVIGFILGLGMDILSILWGAYVFTIMWGWFLLPVTGITIPFIGGVGLLFVCKIISLYFSNNGLMNDTDEAPVKVIISYFIAWFLKMFTLLMILVTGWVAGWILNVPFDYVPPEDKITYEQQENQIQKQYQPQESTSESF